MWSDSIFAVNDRSKLNLLARAIEASYRGGRRYVETVVMSNVTQHTSFPFPESYSFTMGGELILIMQGTTYPLQYAQQYEGWQTPEFAMGGRVNHFYYALHLTSYPMLPNGIDLFVGHSLGGAVCHMLSTKFAGSRCVTFGCPRYCNTASQHDGPWTEARHYSNPLDPVPLFPPGNLGLTEWKRAGQSISLTDLGFLYYNETPTSLGRIIGVAWQNGTVYHEIRSYGGMLGVPATFTFLGEGNVSTNLFRCLVQGHMNEQAVLNEIWYIPEAGLAPSANANMLAEDLKYNWQTWVMPQVSGAYGVNSFRVQNFWGPVSADPAIPSAGSLMRWGDGVIWPGIDAAGGSVGAAMASFNAVGIVKGMGVWRDSAGVQVGGQKLPKGSMRIASPLESSTGANGDNRLTSGAQAVWLNIAQRLATLRSAGGARTWFMAICSIGNASGPFLAGTPPAPTYRYALVTNATINPYVTSQTSRKQRQGNLG